MSEINIVVIIPIYNPNHLFYDLLDKLRQQRITNMKVLLIDSGNLEKHLDRKNHWENQFTIKKIQLKDFNHGGTRQWGMSLFPCADIFVFLTQDAVLVDEYYIARLVDCFKDKKIGAAYGRQLPHKNASIFAWGARKYNYGEGSYKYSLIDRKKHGIKTCFFSNSFAAYRKKSIDQVGGFPIHTILSEDMCVAARMLMQGWNIAYIADACVYHSHNYTIKQEFSRYFDIGVFHARENWIRNTFGSAEGEGKRYFVFELKLILKYKPWLLGTMIVRDFAKWLGYRLGIVEKYIPIILKRKLAMNKRFFA